MDKDVSWVRSAFSSQQARVYKSLGVVPEEGMHGPAHKVPWKPAVQHGAVE